MSALCDDKRKGETRYINRFETLFNLFTIVNFTYGSLIFFMIIHLIMSLIYRCCHSMCLMLEKCNHMLNIYRNAVTICTTSAQPDPDNE